MAYSKAAQRKIHATGASELPLYVLEIHHTALTQPIRVVSDTQDLIHLGNRYTAMPFRVTFPDDLSNGQPKATLSVDNVGKELVQWLELSNGGVGATATIKHVLRSAPNIVQREVSVDLSGIEMSAKEVAGTLGYEDFVNMPGVAWRFTPEHAPALFTE